MPRLPVEGIRTAAARLGCTPVEVLALAVLALGSAGCMALLWWLQRPPAGVPNATVTALTGTATAVASDASPEVAADARDLPRAGDPITAAAPWEAGETQARMPSTVRVHVTGKVKAPGVYALAASARIVDALAAAGGPTSEADLEVVNLAQPVSDGLQIRIPAPGESPPPNAPMAPPTAVEHGGEEVVDLNTANAHRLETLPGVGPVTAQRILDYRAQIGEFRSVDELLDVPGIGEATLAGFADRVAAGG